MKEGDEIKLGKRTYVVTDGSGGWFLSCKDHMNGVIFKELKLNKESFTESILGYYKDGDFPYCHNLKDLQMLVDALNGIKPFTITREQLHKGYELACSAWKERIMSEFANQLIKPGTTVTVRRGLVDELYKASSNKTQKDFLNELFPDINICSSDDLEVGEYMRTTTERTILKTYNSFIDIDDPSMTWGHEAHKFKGVKVKVTHTIEK